MPWKLETALAMMAGTSRGIGSWVVELGRQKAGWLVLIGVAVACFGAGATSVVWFGDFSTWGDRITALENWRTTHEREVSEPGMARIETLERRQDAFRDEWAAMWDEGGEMRVMRQMVHEMYCQQFPVRCRPQPGGE